MAVKETAAKVAIDRLIKKARVHFYKPIQIAEILYRDRVHQDIDLSDLETYRTRSKKWRDEVCEKFIGRVSSSSAKYQDNIFDRNAIPPEVLVTLARSNRDHAGVVEAYIYNAFRKRLSVMYEAVSYVEETGGARFELGAFLDLFWREPGLKRSIDKIYEIVVFALFSALVEALGVSVEVSVDPEKHDLLREFSDFAALIVNLGPTCQRFRMGAKIHRVGVTNAADRGLDMFANFGLAIQIKHLSLTEEMAEGIVNGVTADRIVIVCKDNEKNIIVSLLNQIGWKSRIQSIVTEQNLVEWYRKALRGDFSGALAANILERLCREIQLEFPSVQGAEFDAFFARRDYSRPFGKSIWSVQDLLPR